MSSSLNVADKGYITIPTKCYNGDYEVAHPVQDGETLFSIARVYRITDWKTIFLYNAEVIRTISANPDLVKKGVTILIPRSKKKYDMLIKRNLALIEEIKGAGAAEIARLEGLGFGLEAQKELFNFAGDVLTLTITVAQKSIAASRAANVALSAAGQAKIAARSAMRTESETLAKEYASAHSRLLKGYKLAEKEAGAARYEVKELLKGAGLNAASNFVDDRYKKSMEGIPGAGGNPYITDPRQSPGKDVKNVYVATQAIKALRATKNYRQALLEGIGIAVDYLTVSGIAETWIRLTTGESAEGSIEKAKEQVEKSTDQAVEMLRRKVERLKEERNAIYS